ncbi:MAG: hypothetical protein KDA71_18820 [Planctomycetales bacterium]|nr:hypothetical protein [Planctomycetales bacterium]
MIRSTKQANETDARPQSPGQALRWTCLWRDEFGSLLTSEYLILGTILTLGMIVGINAAQTSLVSELEDYAAAIYALDNGSNDAAPPTFLGAENGTP